MSKKPKKKPAGAPHTDIDVDALHVTRAAPTGPANAPPPGPAVQPPSSTKK